MESVTILYPALGISHFLYDELQGDDWSTKLFQPVEEADRGTAYNTNMFDVSYLER